MLQNPNTSKSKTIFGSAPVKTESQRKDEIIAELRVETADLKQKLAEKPPKIHNERHAGRKPKVSYEMKTEIKNLHNQGLSSAEIAKIFIQKTGVIISKSTVYKLINEINKN